MRTEWVVLADAGRARIFARVAGAGWQPIRDLTRSFNGHSSDGREVRLPYGLRKLDAVVSGGAQVQDEFAERLARELMTARKRGDFDALVLIAPSDVLGKLTEMLDAATRRKVTATATDNLVSLPIKEARRQIARRF